MTGITNHNKLDKKGQKGDSSFDHRVCDGQVQDSPLIENRNEPFWRNLSKVQKSQILVSYVENLSGIPIKHYIYNHSQRIIISKYLQLQFLSGNSSHNNQ